MACLTLKHVLSVATELSSEHLREAARNSHRHFTLRLHLESKFGVFFQNELISLTFLILRAGHLFFFQAAEKRVGGAKISENYIFRKENIVINDSIMCICCKSKEEQRLTIRANHRMKTDRL